MHLTTKDPFENIITIICFPTFCIPTSGNKLLHRIYFRINCHISLKSYKVVEVSDETGNCYFNYISIYLLSCMGLSLSNILDCVVLVCVMLIVGYIYISNSISKIALSSPRFSKTVTIIHLLNENHHYLIFLQNIQICFLIAFLPYLRLISLKLKA